MHHALAYSWRCSTSEGWPGGAVRSRPHPQHRAVVVHLTVVLLRGWEAVLKSGQLAEDECISVLCVCVW